MANIYEDRMRRARELRDRIKDLPLRDFDFRAGDIPLISRLFENDIMGDGELDRLESRLVTKVT